MRAYRLAGLMWGFLLPAALVAQEGLVPDPEKEIPKEGVAGVAGEEEEEVKPREAVLDRVLTVPSLGAELRLAPGWSMEIDPLGGRRVQAKGPIEYGLQTSFTIWLVANDEVLGEFRNRFAIFLRSSYPDFNLTSSRELKVGGKDGVVFRLEGKLGKEGGIQVPCVHAFTVVDLKRYKVVALMVWPKEEDDYYTRLHDKVLEATAFPRPAIYQRRTDGVVEVEDYIFRPLVDWRVEFAEAQDEEQDRTIHYVTFTTPTTGAQLKYKLVRENVVSTPEEYARVKYEQYRADEMYKFVRWNKLQDGLARLMVQVEVGGVPNWVLMFFSGRAGRILVATVHVPEDQWKDLKNSANQMGSTFALREFPRPLIDFEAIEEAGGKEAGKKGEAGGGAEGAKEGE